MKKKRKGITVGLNRRKKREGADEGGGGQNPQETGTGQATGASFCGKAKESKKITV